MDRDRFTHRVSQRNRSVPPGKTRIPFTWNLHGFSATCFVLWLVLVSGTGCGGKAASNNDLEDERPPPGIPYASTRLLQVNIELAQPDWEALRRQGRRTPWTLGGCDDPDFTYDDFPAEVRIDGQAPALADVSKKGYLGSLSVNRPSLKVDFGSQTDGVTLGGERRLTLNNDRQDASHVAQCLAYGLFARAGLPAPRCSHARLVVNGEDLGIYTRVEPIKKPFLARVFGDDSGNLYEGQAADFSPGLLDRFQYKTNAEGNDGSDLSAVVAALGASDDELYEQLDRVINLDDFLSYWALEVLVAHREGYAGKQDNFYLYKDPVSGKLSFIPWGADTAFRESLAHMPNDHPRSVLAHTALTQRLYDAPTTRALYHERLQTFLDTLWDEALLIAEVRRIGELTGVPEHALVAMEQFIVGRRAAVQTELDAALGASEAVFAWPYEPPSSRPCVEPTATRGSFEIVWSDVGQSDFQAASVEVDEMTLGTQPVAFGTESGSAFGVAATNADPAIANLDTNLLGIAGPEVNTGQNLLLGFLLPRNHYQVGDVPLHGFETFGAVVVDDELVAIVGDGVLKLEATGAASGEPVRGSWSGFLGLHVTGSQ